PCCDTVSLLARTRDLTRRTSGEQHRDPTRDEHDLQAARDTRPCTHVSTPRGRFAVTLGAAAVRAPEVHRRTATEPSVAIENPSAEAGHAGCTAVLEAGSPAVRPPSPENRFN